MSDANKLSLARAIHGTPHATRDSFSPSTWAGVERAWAWVEKHYQPKDDPLFLNEYVDRLQRHLAMMREEPKEPTVSEWMPKIKRYVLIGNDEIREDEHGAWWMDEHTASLIRSLRKQPKEPTVKQEPTIYGAPIIEDAHMPSGYGLVGVNMSAFEKPAPSPAPAGVPDRDALANAMQLALAKSPNDVVAPLRECRLDVVDLRYRQADAALEMFAPALRTRDERIAEQAATIATLTKERDEARQNLTLHTINGQDIDSYVKANAIAERRTGILGNIFGAVGHMDELIDSYRARVAELEKAMSCAPIPGSPIKLKSHGATMAECGHLFIGGVLNPPAPELEKRGAVDVEACAHEINQEVHGDAKAWFHRTGDWWFGDQRIAAILRKHSRDVRRITREDAVRLWQRLPNSTWNELTDALRAIGFEVEA